MQCIFNQIILAATVLASVFCRRHNFGLHAQVQAIDVNETHFVLDSDSSLENTTSREFLQSIDANETHFVLDSDSSLDNTSSRESLIGRRAVLHEITSVANSLSAHDKEVKDTSSTGMDANLATASTDSNANVLEQGVFHLAHMLPASISSVLVDIGVSRDTLQENTTVKPEKSSLGPWLAVGLGVVVGWCCCCCAIQALSYQRQGEDQIITRGGSLMSMMTRKPTFEEEPESETRESPRSGFRKNQFHDQTVRLKKKAVKFLKAPHDRRLDHEEKSKSSN